jgi:HK97 family phage prohead protease
VTLCDGRSGLRGGIHVDIRASDLRDNSCNSCLDFVSSDETLDRYDEIISASGWQITNYQRNPVFQNAHQYGDIIFTLGKALITEVRNGRLYQRIEFATDVNPMARIAYGLYRGKFLNAVSVGFIPLRWENGSVEKGFRRKYLSQELLEVSAVGIPANPNALALGLKAGAVEKSDLKELSELIAHTLHSDAPARSQKLLPLAREIRDLLKRI